MTARAKHRGHPIEWCENNAYWRYVENEERPCVECHVVAEPGGPDPCLGRLPGVRAACCGHGDPRDAYFLLDNETYIRGLEAVKLKLCWELHSILPKYVFQLYETLNFNADLTFEFCKMSNKGFPAWELLEAARCFEMFRINSFDFERACDILKATAKEENAKSRKR